MNKNLMKRLIALVLTGGILLSSTGVYTALATEETTTSEYTSALVGSAVENTTASEETTTESTTDAPTTEAPSTTEKPTESTTHAIQKPETTTPPETTTKPPVKEEEVIVTPNTNVGLTWVGVNGSSVDAGTQSNPYAVSTPEHFLGMSALINDSGNDSKYFQLTANLDFSSLTFGTDEMKNYSKGGMEYSLLSIDPTLSHQNVFFVLDGSDKKITGIKIESNSLATLSVIGYINSSSEIKNLTFENITINNTSSAAKATGVILKNEGVVNNCSFRQIDITMTSSDSADSYYPNSSLRVYTGVSASIVDNSGVYDSSAIYGEEGETASVTDITIATNHSYAGALAAQNRGKINKVRAKNVSVLGSDTASNIGGLVGANLTSRISSSTGVYDVELLGFKAVDLGKKGVSGADNVGGLVGYNTGKIDKSRVVGEHKTSSTNLSAREYSVLVKGTAAAGGVVGNNTGVVQNCSALDIGAYFESATDGAIYGGIAGKSTNAVSNCVATGLTAGEGNAIEVTRYIGGIVGLGSTDSSFKVERCYALVRIIESKADLGAIVGWNGDEAYSNGKISDVYYSSIISSRPSPVSFGATGKEVGDLIFSRPYAVASYLYDNRVEASVDEFEFTGWSEAIIGEAYNLHTTDTTISNYANCTITNNSTLTYRLKTNPSYGKARIYYDVDITLPPYIGNKATVLTAEPMEFGILNSREGAPQNISSGVAVTDGTEDNPIYITAGGDEFNLIYHAPAAHIIVNKTISGQTFTNFNVSSSTYVSNPATFWGTIDFSETTITYQSGSLETKKPLFKAIYGARGADISNDGNITVPSDDPSANLKNGVVENVSVILNNSNSMSNMFGSISNATVKNVSITTGATLNATDSNSGLFAKAVYGDSYLYGCYVKPDMTKISNATQVAALYNTGSFNAVSGFIGTIDAEKAIIDNCGANIIVSVDCSNATNCAVFVGNIKSLDGGVIQNCYASGGVRKGNGSFSANNYIFAGEINRSSTSIINCFYSPSDYYKNKSYRDVTGGAKPGSFTGSCSLWSFIQLDAYTSTWGTTSQLITTAGAGESFVYLDKLENIDKFNFGESTTLNSYFEKETDDTSVVTLGQNISSNPYPNFSVKFNDTVEGNARANVLATHKETGLMARLVVSNASELDTIGAYYQIKSPEDLYFLASCDTDTEKNEYWGAKYQLAADIDLTGYTIPPIGDSNKPFTGVFMCETDASGAPLYTISNYSMSTRQFPALFGGVSTGAEITNIRMDNADVYGTSSAGVLVNRVYGNVNITNCSVVNSTVTASKDIGAIVGTIMNSDGGSHVTITNCTVENTTLVSNVSDNTASVGGIIGSVGQSSTNITSAEIANCKVTNCDISGQTYNVGGVVGYAPTSHSDKNTITGCTVTSSKIYTTNTSISVDLASVGGIAGSYAGAKIDSCNVVDSEVTGVCVAGIVSKLPNPLDTLSTVSNCTVTNTDISANNIAGGIVAQAGNSNGNKTIDNCKVTATSSVTALVSGGIIGNISDLSQSAVLNVQNCTNLATVKTTGVKGSNADAAGGIVGRIATLQHTSNIHITGCLSKGQLVGNSVLGGIIGTHSGNAHTGSSKLITACFVSNPYVTDADGNYVLNKYSANSEKALFSSTNRVVVRGLIIGYVGGNNSRNCSALSENNIYSSVDSNYALFGNVNVNNESELVYDVNTGADGNGLLVSPVVTTANRASYTLDSIEGLTSGGTVDNPLISTNTINLKQNYNFASTVFSSVSSSNPLVYKYNGTTYTATTKRATIGVYLYLPTFSVTNTPDIGAKIADNTSFGVGTLGGSYVGVFATDTSDAKIKVGSYSSSNDNHATTNKLTNLTIQTFDKKCNAEVYAYYSGTVNGETIRYKIAFNVVVSGTHFFDGTGTQDDPFIIRDAEDLLSIKQHHDNPNVISRNADGTVAEREDGDFYYAEGTYYEVVNDITDMAEQLDYNNDGKYENVKSFAPIGTADDPFKATIMSTPGEKYVISNIIIKDPKTADNYAFNNEYTGTDDDGNTIAPQYSDALGVFGYTDGATIADLEFENVVIEATPSESYMTGRVVGSVVGNAVNTIISNVSVTGQSSINVAPNGTLTKIVNAGGIVGYAGSTVIMSEVEFVGSSKTESGITANGSIGGIVGSSEGAEGGSITSARVENLTITNSATSGKALAGGIAGIYTGTVTGTYNDIIDENTQEVTTVRTPAVVNNVAITGGIVGGVVATGSESTSTGISPFLKITAVDVTNTIIEVTESVRKGKFSATNGIAGGILGKSEKYYKYLIEDSTIDGVSSITTGYTAGGIVGKVLNNTSGSLLVETELFIKNCESLVSITQDGAPTEATAGQLSQTNRRQIGIGSIIGVVYRAVVMDINDHTPQIQINDSKAGGTLTGTYNVGGIIGQFASIQPDLYNAEGAIVSNCMLTAKLVAGAGAAKDYFGVILGAVDNNTSGEDRKNGPFPDSDASGNPITYKTKLFDKIFYSSYTVGNGADDGTIDNYKLYGNSLVNSYQDPVYSSFTSTIYDVNKVVYNLEEGVGIPLGFIPFGVKDDPATGYLWFGGKVDYNEVGYGAAVFEFDPEFVTDVLDANGGSGTPYGFELAGESFTLMEGLSGITSDKSSVFTVVDNTDGNGYTYKVQPVAKGIANLVFNYTNGIQIAIPLLSGESATGKGSLDSPISVSSEIIFRLVPKYLPGYVYQQTADLDFTSEEPIDGTVSETFTGVYFGNNHSITGLTVNTADSADTVSGVFGNVTGQWTDNDGNIVPNVQDLTFINTTVTSDITSGSTGLVAGSVTNGASIENIKVVDSNVTAKAGAVGGIAGTVSDGAALKDVSFTGTDGNIVKITSSKGSVGGIAGVVTDSASQIIAPEVKNVTIISGTDAGSVTEDIAGGIVAQAAGTISGGNKLDGDGNVIEGEYADAVSGVNVKAFISGGAVGALYNPNALGNGYTLNLENIRVANTSVSGKAVETNRTGMTAAALLGAVRGAATVSLNNCYADKQCSVDSQYYAGGVIGVAQPGFVSIDITDTETYATVLAKEPQKDYQAYAGGIIGFVQSNTLRATDLNNITMNGAVAGGKITAEAFESYAGGVLGGYNYNDEEGENNLISATINSEFFVNGVISASVITDGQMGSISGTNPTELAGKFIGFYDEANLFPTENTKAAFDTAIYGNYYSSYPQNISFFPTKTDSKNLDNLIDKDDSDGFVNFKDINVGGSLLVSTDMSSWNNVAVTGEINMPTGLYAKVATPELPYGNGKVSFVDSDGFSLGADQTGDDLCIQLDSIEKLPNNNYRFQVTPLKYGASNLGMTYTCGLATTVPILCVEMSGAGTVDSPFLISNPTQLSVVGYLTAEGTYFKQINDIDLSNSYNESYTSDERDINDIINYNGGKGFAPLGTSSNSFKGVYDGQGYKITGMYINRNDTDYVGLFGVVEGNTAVIKNVHLELTLPENEKANGILGKTTVGGIAGKIKDGLIENCSVALGSITGENFVGGIVGEFENAKLRNCFTQSDVNAFGRDGANVYASGIVAKMTNAANGALIDGCFSSSNVYSTRNSSINGDFSNASGIVGYIAAANGLTISDCLFTGTTSSGLGLISKSSGLNVNYTVSNSLDAGMNVAMNSSDSFSKLAKVVTGAVENAFTDVYYDSSLLKVTDDNTQSAFSGMTTSSLTNGSAISSSWNDGWTFAEGFYPVPKVSSIEVSTYTVNADGSLTETKAEPKQDAYSFAYSRMLSSPVNVDAAETFEAGLVYPVTLNTNIESQFVTYSSSIFDETDTVEYNKEYDKDLYGVGANKNVDLLFETMKNEDGTQTGLTSVYRNIFDTTKKVMARQDATKVVDKNTWVNANALNGGVFENGEAYYNTQVPVVHAEVTIGGVKAERDIKIPLSYGKTYPVATERQLYALGKSGNDGEAGTKFADYYSPIYNYKLIATIDCTGNETPFNPIGYAPYYHEGSTEPVYGYSGIFDGSADSGKSIKNIKIAVTDPTQPVGFFSVVSKDYVNNVAVDPCIKNLTLENATVSGGDMVGTIIGFVKGQYVTVENCHAFGSVERNELTGEVTKYNGTVEGSGTAIGGLIGKVEYPTDIVKGCSATVAVLGGDKSSSVGGLIGESSATVTSSYATGNVICNKLRVYQAGGTETDIINGVGGLIGVIPETTGVLEGVTVFPSVTECFASGNVEVRGNAHSKGYFIREKNGIGGFVGYVKDIPGTDSVDIITQCFSGGNVTLGSDEENAVNVSVNSAHNQTVIVGVGGFSGVNFEPMSYCYSSAAVDTVFSAIQNNPTGEGSYSVGIGGVSGVALAGINNIYSSGSVAEDYDYIDETSGNGKNYAIGGTIGTTMGNASSGAITYERCYFDRMTNTIPDLKSIGDATADTGLNSSLTTENLTGTSKPCDEWSDTGWGFAENAYPYLTSLLKVDSDKYITANAILSVICVDIDPEDVSAKQGLGVTMALTVPSTFVYDANGDGVIEDTEEAKEKYTLSWSGANIEEGSNLATITRTQNKAENVELTVFVDGLEENGTRIYSRQCADMKGTYEQPYLIGSNEDLKYINMNAETFAEAKVDFPDFYGQWATPLSDTFEQTNGKVYYRLMSNINVTDATSISTPEASYIYDVKKVTTDANGDPVVSVESQTFNYEGFVFNGSAYAIKNISKSSGTFFDTIDENSLVSNMVFENVSFTSGSNSALVKVNNGQLIDIYVKATIGDGVTPVTDAAGLVLDNNGTVEGCVVDAEVKGAQSNVGIMALNNNSKGEIINSGTAGSITTSSTDNVQNIGAFVGTNAGTVKSSFSMVNVDVKTPSNSAVNNISGFAGTNTGVMNGVYSRSSLTFDSKPAETLTVASLAGTVGESATVSNAYTAGLLQYYNDSQDSIAFGTVSDGVNIKNIYVDKALAGQTSKNSFKYSALTSSIVNMEYMDSEMKYDENAAENGLFTAADIAVNSNAYPQLTAILRAKNIEVIDENGDPIPLENGTVIRNFDIIKKYSELSSMTIATKQGQYIDRLALTSKGIEPSLRSASDAVRYVPKNSVININNSTYAVTANSAGEDIITVEYKEVISLKHDLSISPKLNIYAAATNDAVVNPNFSDGIGTKEKPYKINDANSLQSLYYYGTDSGLYFELANDIEMKDYPFEQISVFKAHLNEDSANMYAIENLESTGGVFGLVDVGAVIKNVALAGADIKSSGKYTGALADKVSGATIENCVVSANVTSTSTEADASTGLIAGIASNASVINDVVTTGNANAVAGAVGGVIGYTENTAVSDALSTANVCDAASSAGIIGTMGANSTLTNALYAGVAKSKNPIVSSVASDGAVTEAYYDSQQFDYTDNAEIIGTALTTAESKKAFANGTDFTSAGNGYYPIPSGVVSALTAEGTASSYAETLGLASTVLTYYLGSSRGSLGYYTSLQFADNVKGSPITAAESGNEGYFLIAQPGNQTHVVTVKRYSETADPTIVLSTENGAQRTINPGLVRTANISYKIVDAGGLLEKENKSIYSVLIKSAKDKSSFDDVNVVNDFTADTTNSHALDPLIISKESNGFYVGDMLPAGLKYNVSATLNGKAIDSSKIKADNGSVYGTFVELSVEGDNGESTVVELTLTVAEDKTPWGVRSQNSTLK